MQYFDFLSHFWVTWAEIEESDLPIVQNLIKYHSIMFKIHSFRNKGATAIQCFKTELKPLTKE